ncbi:MAG: divalent-cation tolerance protein CutA [Kiritimatiellaceae bacterium]|nr:divalent-cation tolerance protein CutA [Kiritimatiellaceae bacterium]
MKINWIYITTASREEAEKIAETVITEKLAACANLLGDVTSMFHWKGTLCREKEAVLILKTTEALTEELMARVKSLHSYECPCIVVLPIEQGHLPFLQWVQDEVRR